jgi:hypothetical protein
MVASEPRSTDCVVIDWDVAGLPTDVATVETLARFQLAARRRGYTLRLRNAPAELVDLIAALGLSGVLRD